jgi:imidazolonepropionase-like amidohydrolase
VSWAAVGTPRALLLLFAIAAPGLTGAQTIAIRGGTVITMAGPRIPNGTVLIRDGKIAAVGTNVAIPAGTRVVDATGRFVMPGIVDPITYFGVPPEYLNDDEPITPQLKIIHNYSPWRLYTDRGGPLRISELLSGGVTTQYIGPGDATVVGGQGVVVKTASRNYASAVLRNPAAMDITIGERPARTFRARNGEPSTRAAVLELLREAFNDAREYGRRGTSPSAGGAAGASSAPPRDLRLEALQLVLARRIPARIQANRPEDIRDAIRLAEEFGFDLVIDGGSFAHEMRAELAAKKIAVVLGPPSRSYAWTQDSPHPEEFPEPEERAAGWLARAGVKVAIGSFARGHYAHNEAITGKWLLLDAILASAYGLPEDDALKAVTINAAQILGVADRVGSLEPGKDADVIILGGPPNSILSRVEHVFVNGVLSFTRVTN